MRRVIVWAICYLGILQGFSGAAASAAMAGALFRHGLPAASAPAPAHLCRSDPAGGAPPAPHQVLAACCDLCAAAGTPVLPAPRGCLNPVTRCADAPGPVPAGLPSGHGCVCENARSRAPPPA